LTKKRVKEKFSASKEASFSATAVSAT